MSCNPAAASKSKKRKRAPTTTEDVTASTATATATTAAATPRPQSQSGGKKQRTKLPTAKKKGDAVKAGTDPAGSTEPDDAPTKDAKKACRFIVFIGNLPYTATAAALQSHFAAVKPVSIRVITEKAEPAKCKGFAFLEFEGYDRMKSCLTRFHHTTFNDGISEARKINVELTAGGGGNSKARRNKLHTKNERLNGQRRRRMQEEEKLRQEKREKAQEEGNSNIHPSRRNRVK